MWFIPQGKFLFYGVTESTGIGKHLDYRESVFMRLSQEGKTR
jgi:hypothetical protein